MTAPYPPSGPTFPTPGPTPYYGAPLTKPTDVMGRRIGAFFIDVILVTILIGGFVFLLLFAIKPGKRYSNVQNATGETPTQFCDHYDPDDHNNKVCIGNDDDDTVTLIDGGPLVGSILGVSAGVLLINYVLLEGLAGGTLGKLIVGLRVVRERGNRCGVGWAALRNLLLWIPDGFFFCLVGLIVSLTNDDHQRVGDLAAGTFVVDRRAVGHPVRQVPAGFAGYAPPGQTFAAQPYGQPPAPFPQPSQPAQAPGGFAPVTPAPTASQPQWDQARNTYIWWSPEQQQWLEHDREADQWRPISQ